MVAAQLDETLVEGMGDHIMIVAARLERAVAIRLELKTGAHAAQLEVPQPQLTVRERCVQAERIELGRSGRQACSPSSPGGSGRRVDSHDVLRPFLQRSPLLEREAPEHTVGIMLRQPLAFHEHTLCLRDHFARPQRAQESYGKVVIGLVRFRCVQYRRRRSGDFRCQRLGFRGEGCGSTRVDVERSDSPILHEERGRKYGLDPEGPGAGCERGPAALLVERLGVEPTPLRRGVDTGALAGLVLRGIHGGDRLIRRRDRRELAASAERHTDPVGSPDDGPGQCRGQAERGIDNFVVGMDGGELPDTGRHRVRRRAHGRRHRVPPQCAQAVARTRTRGLPASRDGRSR